MVLRCPCCRRRSELVRWHTFREAVRRVADGTNAASVIIVRRVTLMLPQCCRGIWRTRQYSGFPGSGGPSGSSPGRARRQPRARGCEAASRRVHSRYERRLLDTAIGGCEVVVCLKVRQFLYMEPGCAKATFAEQVSGLTSRHARRTPVVTALLAAVALALGGPADARMSGHSTAAVSWMTLLRLIRAMPGQAVSASPWVLGVDEFALRKGHRYGTLLVDVETRRLVDILDERSSESFAVRLAGPPGRGADLPGPGRRLRRRRQTGRRARCRSRTGGTGATTWAGPSSARCRGTGSTWRREPGRRPRSPPPPRPRRTRLRPPSRAPGGSPTAPWHATPPCTRCCPTGAATAISPASVSAGGR
jgi:hypothetical protein